MSVHDGMTLAQVARLTGGRVEGDDQVRVVRPAPLETAQRHELGLVADPAYLGRVAGSSAGALLVAEDLADRIDDGRPRVVVADPRAAMRPLLVELDPTPRPSAGVHPTAVVDDGVELGEGVSVGPYAVVSGGVALGDRVVVGAHCVVGAGCSVGPDTYLHPHVVLYPGTVLGQRVVVHAGARLGSDGFGFVVQDGAYRKVPQVGGCVVGDDVEIGANTCLDRGSIGDTVVGQGSKLDNLIHLAHNVRVGRHVAMAAMTGIAGSATIGDWAQFGGQAGSVGHVRLGAGIRVGAQAGIIGDVEDGATVIGYPARDERDQMRSYAALARLPSLLKRVRALEKEVAALEARLEGDSA